VNHYISMNTIAHEQAIIDGLKPHLSREDIARFERVIKGHEKLFEAIGRL